MNKVFYTAVNLLKFIWDKYYQFIQWTKKWHFFHIISFFSVIFVVLTIFFIYGFNYLESENPNGNFRGFGIGMLMLYIFSVCLILFIATITQLFVIIFKYIQHKSIAITEGFFVENRIYDILYVFSITFIFYLIIHYIAYNIYY